MKYWEGLVHPRVWPYATTNQYLTWTFTTLTIDLKSRSPLSSAPPLSIGSQTLTISESASSVDSLHVRRTEDPRWVHRSRYIPNRRKLPTTSEKDIRKDCRASCDCSEWVPHDFVVQVVTMEQSEES